LLCAVELQSGLFLRRMGTTTSDKRKRLRALLRTAREIAMVGGYRLGWEVSNEHGSIMCPVVLLLWLAIGTGCHVKFLSRTCLDVPHNKRGLVAGCELNLHVL
jgi:hypothetical protein